MFSPLIKASIAVATLFVAQTTLAQSQAVIDHQPVPEIYAAPAPVKVERTDSGVARLTPFYGFGSLNNEQDSKFGAGELNDTQSYGAWFDFGSSLITFQTGFSFDNNQVSLSNGGSQDFNTWGIPLMLKLNFSGQPQSTVYLKAGFNFVDETSKFLDKIDTIGTVGAGANIPLGGKAVALLLEADYNSLMTRESFPSDLNGWKFVTGLSFRL